MESKEIIVGQDYEVNGRGRVTVTAVEKRERRVYNQFEFGGHLITGWVVDVEERSGCRVRKYTITPQQVLRPWEQASAAHDAKAQAERAQQERIARLREAGLPAQPYFSPYQKRDTGTVTIHLDAAQVESLLTRLEGTAP